MKTICIIGPQGSGKTTLARAILRKPTYQNNQAADPENLELAGHFASLFAATKKHRHTLLIDEADVFFSLISSTQANQFKRYWAVARHRGLATAVFIARRYIQIPIYVRTSATQIYISNEIVSGYELKQLEREGCTVHRPVPRGHFLFQKGL